MVNILNLPLQVVSYFLVRVRGVCSREEKERNLINLAIKAGSIERGKERGFSTGI